jgi:hypothetical protein
MVQTAHTKIALVVNEGHALHHVHDRGYVESPARIPAILRGISETGLLPDWSLAVFPTGPSRRSMTLGL